MITTHKGFEIDSKLIGKYAYLKYGFFSHIIGKIGLNHNEIVPVPFIINFKDGGGVGFTTLSDITILNDADTND